MLRSRGGTRVAARHGTLASAGGNGSGGEVAGAVPQRAAGGAKSSVVGGRGGGAAGAGGRPIGEEAGALSKPARAVESVNAAVDCWKGLTGSGGTFQNELLGETVVKRTLPGSGITDAHVRKAFHGSVVEI